jgi:hypothetical protein
VFGDDLRVLFFDGLASDLQGTTRSLLAWAGVDPSRLPDEPPARENQTVNVRHRGAQRVALAANRRLENLFRSQPAVKRGLRSLYYRANRSVEEPPPDAGLVAELRERYAPSNRRSAGILRGAGYADLPAWLADA